MKKRISAYLLCALFALTNLVSFAEGLPDLGDPASNELSPLAEAKLGESIMREIRLRETAYVDDPEITDYLNRIGLRLANASPNPSQFFEFFAIQDSTLNAFALPGGYIGVHTGLLLAAQSESELASVLGHEIAHVTQRHIARNIAASGQNNLLLLGTLLLGMLAARSNPQVTQAAIASGMAGSIQSQLAYSRDFEREADRVGFGILEKAGFDVRGMPSFFERLQKGTRLYDSSAPAYMRSHPLTTERISDMDNRARSRPYKQVIDSLDFQLVRAKIRVNNGTPKEAVSAAQRQLEMAQGASRTPALYELARAALRNRDTALAQEQIAQLRKLKTPSVMIDTLEIDLLRQSKNPDAALKLTQDTRQKQPGSMPLLYAQLELLQETGRYKDTAALATKELRNHSQDTRLWEAKARSHAQLGQRTEEHRAQGELYALRGQWVAAIEQFQFAQRSNDGDFFLQSTVDARLRELKRLYDEELKAQRNNR